MNPRQSLTIVVAAYDEAASLPLLHPRLQAALDAMPDVDGRVLYVDDGSRDGTWEVMRGLAAADPRVSLLRLARNFGKELALTAGLDRVESDAAVVIDADGQEPPELIPQMVARWREGYDVVYGRRSLRRGEGWFKRFTSAAFYRVMEKLSPTPIPRDTGDFRLIARPVLDALRGVRERQRFMKGLFAWVGFRQIAFDYEAGARLAGRSKFDFWRLWNLAIEGITSFSTVPLRVATYVGVLTALLAFIWGVTIIVRTLAWGNPVQGWASTMTVILFLGGVQLMALGVIGEYLGRLYLEAKQRPLYLVADAVPAAADPPGDPPAGL
ncbi:glycosyltransferase family 2 protein [Arenimonas composti]|uniref:Bactoprenol glucosyl transferase n=1 Tax=Arenimonas composti TR7-09 = DSM 18010 TaxID=1121013 RepID=A0A091BBI2_9GAMM|nr:glycosyltransferase family 2 protein [Arenimonas composti]KFN48862.1 bactoprenol glucosyl transferase [Arenimonas composti TR7-09 = DSM 18010]